jgi:hypothetical protein
VEGVSTNGRRETTLTDAGRRYVEEHPDELAATWRPFDDAADDDDTPPGLKPAVGQVMGAVWQVATSGQPAAAGAGRGDPVRHPSQALRPARRRGPGVMSKDLRIGDAERDAAVAALGEHFAAGRIDAQEYEDRSSAAWAARSAGALAPLFEDLPAPHPRGTIERPPSHRVPRHAARRGLRGSRPSP